MLATRREVRIFVKIIHTIILCSFGCKVSFYAKPVEAAMAHYIG